MIELHTTNVCPKLIKPFNRYMNEFWYPEIDILGNPLTYSGIIKISKKILTDSELIVTTSEILILCLCKYIRDGVLKNTDYLLYHWGYAGFTIIDIDQEGYLDDFPGGFFNERLSLLV